MTAMLLQTVSQKEISGIRYSSIRRKVIIAERCKLHLQSLAVVVMCSLSSVCRL